MDETIVQKGIETRRTIMSVIIEYISQHGYPPTVREISELTGLKSTSSVSNHVKRLIREGRLETDGGFSSPRAFRVPGYKFTKTE